MDKGLCCYCHSNPVTGKRRKYCEQHSTQASLLWKREQRRLWPRSGAKSWVLDWKNKSDDERKTYFRLYMREYRNRKRLAL